MQGSFFLLQAAWIPATRAPPFLEPHDPRGNTFPSLALTFKIPEETSIGRLWITCLPLNPSLWSGGKIQLNGPAYPFAHTYYRKNRGQSHRDRRAPRFYALTPPGTELFMVKKTLYLAS